MRKILCGAIVLVAAAALPLTLAAAPEVSFTAEIWNRNEHVENLTDFEDSDGSSDKDNLDFAMYRVRAGLNAKAGDISAYVEIQNSGTWGNNLISSNSQDPNNGPTDLVSAAQTNDMVLYQGWVHLDHIGGSLFSAKIGRQEKTLGNELHIGDADFYSGQYFDGIDTTFDFESWMLNAFMFTVEDRDLYPGALQSGSFPYNGGSDDRTLSGLTAKFTLAEGHDIEPYALYGRDGNEGGGLLNPQYSIWTIGALYEREREFEGPFDWSLEAAIQTGDIGSGPGEVDQSSNVVEGSFGYTFGDEAGSRNRIGVGALILGDGDDPTESEAFMALYPDTHRRAGMADVFTKISSSNFGVNTFHNLTNFYIEWDWHSAGPHSAGAAYHTFTATEDFGAPEDHLGDELDLWYNMQRGEHFNVQVGVANFMPEEDLFLGDDSVLRAYLMGRFRM